jgi:hypothetical protein
MHTQISSRTTPLGIEFNTVRQESSTRILGVGMSRVSLTWLVCSSEYWQMLWRWGHRGLRAIFAAIYLSNILASPSNIHTHTRKFHLAHLNSALNSTQWGRSLQPGYWELGCLECHWHEVYVLWRKCLCQGRHSLERMQRLQFFSHVLWLRPTNN